MLAYILALAVALGSLGIYLAAFFFPEIHRKNDFIWSGVGLFYALVLWACAGRITGGLLLGQVAGVALLGWSVTQALQLRRQLTPRQQQTELPSADEVKNTVQEQISQLSLPQRLSQLGKQVSGSATSAKNRLQQVTSGTKRQSQPETNVTSQAPAASSAAEVTPNVQVIDNRSPIPKPEPPKSTTAATEPTQVKESPLGAEPTANTNQPDGPDMPGPSGKERIPVEEIAPEVELGPPAEPLGSGDPQDRQNPPPPPEAMEAVPIETPKTAPSSPPESESSQEGELELKRPNPPDPEIVEAAIEDAEEKHLEASPPESAEHDSTQDDKPAQLP